MKDIFKIFADIKFMQNNNKNDLFLYRVSLTKISQFNRTISLIRVTALEFSANIIQVGWNCFDSVLLNMWKYVLIHIS